MFVVDARSRLTSSGLRTTGRRRGSRTDTTASARSRRFSVTLKKNRRAVALRKRRLRGAMLRCRTRRASPWGYSDDHVPETEFAVDSPLEGDGFELPVPREKK